MKKICGKDKKISARKIHIIGSVGSGKSTFARQISQNMKIPYYELDNIMWERREKGDRRRPEEERMAMVHAIVRTDSWIVEGVHHQGWMLESLVQSDLIIFLDTPKPKRIFRIIKRFIEEKTGLKKGNYKQTLPMLMKMFKWNHQFEINDKENICRLLKPYYQKVKVMRN
ncbi:DNA topology modulation protein FlaR [Bacillus sp. Marseille-Q1617]|uniref:DNA topology modulation protein FlaR n=1 Tax=Bacillus sp. Marseille-Q1617 TaxID=2736887 RepID=UPI0020CA53CC|nr:DNA topology modulation protein FlaR [Bacillus sp. Marseille-Q1617]